MLFSLVCFHRFIVLFVDSLLLLLLQLLLLLLRSFHFTSHSALRSSLYLSVSCLSLLVQCVFTFIYNIIDWLTGKCMLACFWWVRNEWTYKDRDIRCVCVCTYNFVCPRAHIEVCLCARACARIRTEQASVHTDIIYFIQHHTHIVCEMSVS